MVRVKPVKGSLTLEGLPSNCMDGGSSPSFYRHRLYNQKHLLLEQIMVFEAEIKELERKINPQINVVADAKNQPFLV